MQITGAQAIVKTLLEHDVTTVFGYPGGQVIPLYDTLYDAPFKNILTVHEQGAIHAADGYARASGKVGVCIATSGPGATNIVTGLATAYLDSIPLVVICGQVPTNQIGRDAFQEVDIVSISMAVTKYNKAVLKKEDLLDRLREAFVVAASGRPGPVLLDIPSDLQKAMIDWHEPKDIKKHFVEKEVNLDINKVEEAAKLISQAQRPVILVGGGAIQANCAWAIEKLVDKTNIPVIVTLMGIGAFSAEKPQYLGMSGMHGQIAANMAINKADVLLVVGSRFSERITGDRNRYLGNKKIVQFDIDPSEIDKNVTVALPIVAHLANSVEALANAVDKGRDLNEWWNQIKKWQAEAPVFEDRKYMHPNTIMKILSDAFKDEETIFVTDVGQNQMWAAQGLTIKKPRTHLTSGGCGTMGFSLPAALGAKLAKPQARVVQIAGDGGFKMTGMETFTAVNEELPIISIVLNNQVLGMVKQWQHLFFNKRYSSSILKPFNFINFAQSCGSDGCKVENKEDFIKALEYAKKLNKPYLIEVAIEPGEMVEPMVAPGAAIDEFVDVSL